VDLQLSRKHEKDLLMSCDDMPAIQVEGIGKTFLTYNTPRDRLKQGFNTLFSRLSMSSPKQYFSEFKALGNISFTVQPGETLGVIGHNGSGKSTLLQIISGTLMPTEGHVVTKGRVAALLELGSGFNPEFTGIENIYLNGTILGLSKNEIEARMDDIASFADIGDFIRRPVKTYSSGMMVRLAFAVQSQIEPDILIVDEALAVGDAKFQSKCFKRLQQLKDKGTSILLVTHSADQIVNHCDRALLLDTGQQKMLDESRIVVNYYLDLIFGREKRIADNNGKETDTQIEVSDIAHSLNVKEDRFAERLYYNPLEYRWGDQAACITDFKLQEQNKEPSTFRSGLWVQLQVAIRFDLDVIHPILGITIKTKEGITVFGTNTINIKGHGFEREGKSGTQCVVSVDIHNLLTQGDYFISLGIASKQGEEVVPHDRRYDSIHFQVSATPGVLGVVALDTNIAVNAS
jgi:lipopolysaccharide transport system ATP-binding protein